MKNLFIVLLITCSIVFTISAEIQASNNKFITTRAGLRLRTSPDKSSKVITMLKFGEMVSIIKEEGNETFMDGRYGKWINVKSGSRTGWIFSGFLCDFKPDSIIKPAADFYRNKYSQNEYMVKYDGYTKFNDNQVSIINIIDNYITLEIPTMDRTSLPDIVKGNVIWKYDPTSNQFSEVYNVGHGNTTTLLYLDEDKHLDLIVEDGCCSSPDVHILLGSAKGFNNIYEMKDDCDSDEYYDLKPGNCDKMTFTCSKRFRKTVKVRVKSTDVPIEEESEFMRHFRFNCNNKKIEMNGEGLITGARGNIIALDIKNKTISITDKKNNNENRTFLLSDDVFVSGKTAKSLSDLKTGEDISLEYETLNGKNIALRIDSQEGWSNSGFSENGLVIAVDVKTKKLALKVSGYNHIYNLADDVEFNCKDNRPVDQLIVNEDVKIYREQGKINKITSNGVFVRGTITSVDTEDLVIIIKTDEGDKEKFKLSEYAKISLGNKNATITDIKEGKNVTAHYDVISGKTKLITSIKIYK